MTQSEDRRRDMRKFQGSLYEATRSGDYLAAISSAEELLRVAGEEGVRPLLPEMHDILAAIHLDMRDWSNARRYGRLALEGWEKLDSIDEYQLSMARWFLKFVEEAKEADLKERERLAAAGDGDGDEDDEDYDED